MSVKILPRNSLTSARNRHSKMVNGRSPYQGETAENSEVSPAFKADRVFARSMTRMTELTIKTGKSHEIHPPPSPSSAVSYNLPATFFDWAYDPFGAKLDPEGSRFGFYALETPGIASKIVKNGAFQREKLTLIDLPLLG